MTMKQSQPEQPRKQPKQHRSKMLVNSVVQAGVEILSDPALELTIERLCERAGISAGSLYQYFASKEAVLAEVFRTVIEEEWRRLEQSFTETMDMPFDAAIKHHAKAGLRFVRKVYELEPDFYQKYADSYLPYTSHGAAPVDLEQWSKQTENQFSCLFAKHPQAQNLTAKQIDQLSFVYGRGSVAILRSIIEERPEYIYDDWFMDRLTKLFSLDAMFDE